MIGGNLKALVQYADLHCLWKSVRLCYMPPESYLLSSLLYTLSWVIAVFNCCFLEVNAYRGNIALTKQD